jgi:transposase
MVRCASLFSQVLSLIGRVEFAKHVQELKAERGTKGFSCWGQLVGMLFCQLAQAQSLREICDGLRCCLGKLNHLGLKEAPHRSTLSYANAHRPWELFEKTFYEVLETCQKLAPKKKFRFRNKLLSLDASVIELCVTLFDWAKFRQTKGAVKLHLLLDHEGYLPSFALVTEGKTHEIRVARTLKLPAGSIVAMDRGYNDYRLFGQWTQAGIWFVTKLKSNTSYAVVEKRRALPERNILSDEMIRLSGQAAEKKCPHRLRRVVVWDEEKRESIVLLTNHLEFGATTIAAIYKERWQIELFFKALKQNLKVKTFVGTSANALRIQIWTALIAMLLLKYLQLKSRLGWALSNLVALLRWNLFTYRDLWEWIDDPFETPPLGSVPEQLVLPAMRLDSRNPARA